MEGDLKGYLSGKSTLTFHTPPSYGAGRERDNYDLDTLIHYALQTQVS